MEASEVELKDKVRDALNSLTIAGSNLLLYDRCCFGLEAQVLPTFTKYNVTKKPIQCYLPRITEILREYLTHEI